MTKTKIQKALAIVALATLAFSNVSASTIGTATVSGDASFDTNIDWNDTFPGTATASVENILIKARVSPVLNMAISASEIDLGLLTAGTTANGSLNLEIGTNAISGVTITARSQSGGLTNIVDNDIKISSVTSAADPVAENYTFGSTALTSAASDSSYAASFVATGLTTLEVVDNVIEHTVYSSNKPEATAAIDDVVFTVSATTTAETPAGDYEDRVTFTVTGNF